MRLGIDLQSAVDDLRGMGRVVRTLLSQFLKNYPQHEYFLFAKNAMQIQSLRSMTQDWAQTSTTLHFEVLSDLRSATLDTCWYPWNRVDVAPQSGRKIVTICDMARFAFPYTEILRFWDQRKDEKRYRQAAERADQVITISTFSATEIEKYLKIPVSTIPVVSLGVDSASFSNEIQQDANLPPSFATPYLLFVGADSGAKNLPTLLEAFALLKRTYTAPLSLVCWGSGDACRKRHQDILRTGGIAEAVSFPELQQDDALLRRLYRHAELFVFPSIYEGFGLPPLEAMAAGTPVACSRFASMPEVIGDAAIYFDAQSPASMAETMRYMLENEAVRKEYTLRGHQRVKLFTWENSAKQHMNLFEGSGFNSCQ